MQVVASIQKARGKGVDDKTILQEIRKQNPDKEVFFKKAEERGATETQIIDEIIKQNQGKEEKAPTPSPAPTSKRETPVSEEKALAGNKEGKTLLTKEAQEKEENMRKKFLQRIEAKERGESTEDDQFFTPSVSPEEATEMRKEKDSSPEKKNPKIVIVLIIVGGVVFLIFLFLLLNSL